MITRSDAKAQGLSKYFTGVPCRNGHVAERYTQSGTCQDCIRTSRAIVLAPRAPVGEILPPTSARLELQQARVDLEQQKITIKAQRAAVELKKLELQLNRQAERTVAAERKSVVKTQLMDVVVLVDPLDFETVAQLVWSFSVIRNPLLRRDETMTGRQIENSRHVMRCYPDDHKEIIRLTNEMFFRRNAISPGEIEQKLLAAQSALDADAQSNWPEHDPR